VYPLIDPAIGRPFFITCPISPKWVQPYSVGGNLRAQDKIAPHPNQKGTHFCETNRILLASFPNHLVASRVLSAISGLVVSTGPGTKIAFGSQDAYPEVESRQGLPLLPGCVPVFSTDGLKHYFCALTAHCDEWVQLAEGGKSVWTILTDFAYAEVIKQQRRFRLVKVEHRHIWGLAADYVARLKAAGLSGNINTSFVERASLTLRQCVSKLTRPPGDLPNSPWN
jgi:hypothetical protein